MSHLPEDLNLWPSDPFAVLNLKRSDDARTAKRAYFKLVRKYKPDQFPGEFQKIREAYESVENQLQWQTHNERYDEVAAQDPEAAESVFYGVSNEIETFSLPSETKQEAPRRILTEPMDQFFESLNSAGLATAVEHLKNIDPSHGSEQIAHANLANYFLNRFCPEPNSPSAAQHASPDKTEVPQADQKRIAWLLKSINSSSNSHAAMAELRNEFDQNYRLANCKIVNDFLPTINDSRTLASFHLLRWQAIGHSHPHNVVEDLKRIQPRSLELGGIRGEWMNLVAESMNYTVWQTDPLFIEHNENCWREISENDQSWVADSVELLMLAAEQWKGMNDNWTKVIPWARNMLPITARSMWTPVANEISADLNTAISKLDSLFMVFSMAMTLFGEGLRNLASITSDSDHSNEPSWDETRELVASFFKDTGRTDYQSNRVLMMEFCINNQIPTTTFASAADSFITTGSGTGWFELVQGDGALRCVVNACHAVNS